MAAKNIRIIFEQIFTGLITAVFVLIGFFTGIALSQFLQSNQYSIFSIFIVAATAALCIFISILVHNFGHYTAGRILGYKLINSGLGDFYMVPSQKEPTLGKSLFYISGGVMATLLAGIIFLMLFIFNPFSLNPQILFFLLSLSLSFFLNTGINISSYYSDGIPTDGKLIWNIIFKSSTFPEYYINMTNIGRSLEYGIRPKRIPMKDFDLSKDPSSFDIIFILNLYYKALDDKDISSAMKYFRLLEKNISKVPENLAYHVNGELCFINCVIGNSDKSAYYYEKIKDAIENKFDMTSLRIRAYFEYYADHDNSASLFFLKAALCSRDNFENKGLIPLETRFIKELLQKI